MISRYSNELILGNEENPPQLVSEDCFHLSVNDCDCDVVFYCKIICEDRGQGSTYDGATETCCCV